jgi:Tfp pilus assembly protein PilF
MRRYRTAMLAVLCTLAMSTSVGRSEIDPVVQQHWVETRSSHFHVYSTGPAQEVFRLSARLEQFRDAYAQLAGPQAVTSPPIIVLAFPDVASMQAFLPQYQGKPISLAGFFKRGSDENLIVLALAGQNSGSMHVIFHEYTHLLLRQNENIWPLWLQEGMAEIYSTFDAAGHDVRFGLPIQHHLHYLADHPLVPLHDLFAVSHDSPEYNESELQGVFYAESWLLTHYLMLGGNPQYKARFKNLTAFLRLGQKPDQAFTNAFGVSLATVEEELRHYVTAEQFDSIRCVVRNDLSAARAVATRPIGPVETYFHLGDELMRIGRYDAAGEYFTQAQKLAPASPLPFEGLGLLAAQQKKSDEAVRWLGESLQKGSTDFLAHYVYARERYHLSAHDGEHYSRLDKTLEDDIRGNLEKAVSLMPDFGPAHELLGFFEMVQGEDLTLAKQQLQRAIQLDPGNQWYMLSLAQAEMAGHDPTAARRTLEPLRLPYVDADLRTQADKMYREIANLERN